MFEKLLNLPVLASEHGKDVDNFIIYIHWLMIALFVGWAIYFVYVLWRFHEKKNPKADYVGTTSHSSTWVEGLVVLVEAFLLIGLAIPLWAKVVDQVPRDGSENLIRVVAQQFAWNFLYPGEDRTFGAQDIELVTIDNKFGKVLDDPAASDDFETFNDLHIPLGEATVFHISSMDVIHSFKVIALRVCQDAIPGLSIPTWCVPTIPGRYQINCAQLCGNAHSRMIGGFLTVETPEEYRAWVAQKTAEQQASGGGGLSFE